MKGLDYYLSYLYPVSVEITSSVWNHFLEVELYWGEYSLNSENTNYSFGAVHAMFKKLFEKLNMNWERIHDILILGFGTGSVAEIINKNKPDCKIDGVEIDNKVIELGKKYFHTDQLRNVTIYCAGADLFIKDCQKKYDLIIMDCYNDLKIPEELETEQFLICIKNALRMDGLLIFNKFDYSKETRDQIPLLRNLFEKLFKISEILTIMRTGKIFIAKNS